MFTQCAYASEYFAKHFLLGGSHIVEYRFAFVESRDDDHSALFTDPEARIRAVDHDVGDVGDIDIRLRGASPSEGLKDFLVARGSKVKNASLMFHEGFDDD